MGVAAVRLLPPPVLLREIVVKRLVSDSLPLPPSLDLSLLCLNARRRRFYLCRPPSILPRKQWRMDLPSSFCLPFPPLLSSQSHTHTQSVPPNSRRRPKTPPSHFGTAAAAADKFIVRRSQRVSDPSRTGTGRLPSFTPPTTTISQSCTPSLSTQ